MVTGRPGKRHTPLRHQPDRFDLERAAELPSVISTLRFLGHVPIALSTKPAAGQIPHSACRLLSALLANSCRSGQIALRKEKSSFVLIVFRSRSRGQSRPVGTEGLAARGIRHVSMGQSCIIRRVIVSNCLDQNKAKSRPQHGCGTAAPKLPTQDVHNCALFWFGQHTFRQIASGYERPSLLLFYIVKTGLGDQPV